MVICLYLLWHVQEHKNCFYHGTVVEFPGWTVAMSTCAGLRWGRPIEVWKFNNYGVYITSLYKYYLSRVPNDVILNWSIYICWYCEYLIWLHSITRSVFVYCHILIIMFGFVLYMQRNFWLPWRYRYIIPHWASWEVQWWGETKILIFTYLCQINL